uniref:Dienelactone hydrolase domain-containing protein n=1 Tax=Mycena chlorophos TaxID=658473 RepID=A0ABQ0L8I4_MYCCL|nr:predicted protein [Mycena chlorophos]
MVELGGVPCYVATPEGAYAKDKVVLYLSDAQLLADDFARHGYKVVVPDLFNGDPVPPEVFAADAPPFDWMAWLPNHGAAQTRPLIDAVLTALHTSGISSSGIACAGYCFGARFTLDLAFDNLIAVAAIAHPSRLSLGPDAVDMNKYRTVAKAPLLINGCEHDPVFPPADQEITDSILGDGKFAPGYKRVYWAGCAHGFAIRGDLKDEGIRKAKEGALKETLEWFGKYF